MADFVYPYIITKTYLRIQVTSYIYCHKVKDFQQAEDNIFNKPTQLFHCCSYLHFGVLITEYIVIVFGICSSQC